MLADQFFDAFLPGLAATLMGVAIGVPIGLWLDRVGRARSDAAARSLERARLDQALVAVRESVDTNIEAARRISSGLRDPNTIQLGTDLTTGAWRAIEGDVILGLADDPALRAALGDFFDQVARVERAAELLLDIEIRPPPGQPEPQHLKAEVKGVLAFRVGSLITQGDLVAFMFDQRRLVDDQGS